MGGGRSRGPRNDMRRSREWEKNMIIRKNWYWMLRPVLPVIAHSVWCRGQRHKWAEWTFAFENMSKVGEVGTWGALVIAWSTFKKKMQLIQQLCHHCFTGKSLWQTPLRPLGYKHSSVNVWFHINMADWCAVGCLQVFAISFHNDTPRWLACKAAVMTGTQAMIWPPQERSLSVPTDAPTYHYSPMRQGMNKHCWNTCSFLTQFQTTLGDSSEWMRANKQANPGSMGCVTLWQLWLRQVHTWILLRGAM